MSRWASIILDKWKRVKCFIITPFIVTLTLSFCRKICKDHLLFVIVVETWENNSLNKNALVFILTKIGNFSFVVQLCFHLIKKLFIWQATTKHQNYQVPIRNLKKGEYADIWTTTKKLKDFSGILIWATISFHCLE